MGLIGKRNIENADSTRLLFLFFPFGECEWYCRKHFPSHAVRSSEKYTFFILTKFQMLDVIETISTNNFSGSIYLVDKYKSYSFVKNYIESDSKHNIVEADFLTRITTTDFIKIFK